MEQELKAGFLKALEMLGESRRYMDSSFKATYGQIRQAWEGLGEAPPDPPLSQATVLNTTTLGAMG